MRKKISYLGLILIPFISTSASALKCSTHPISTSKQAEDCAKEFLGSTDELYDFVESKGHLGDTSKCKTHTSQDQSSYFTGDATSFKSHLGPLENCKISNSDPDKYACWTAGPDACWIEEGKAGQTTNRALMKIGKTTGNLITFYPIK